MTCNSLQNHIVATYEMGIGCIYLLCHSLLIIVVFHIATMYDRNIGIFQCRFGRTLAFPHLIQLALFHEPLCRYYYVRDETKFPEAKFADQRQTISRYGRR